jgi:hypothetical protein
MQLFKFSKYHDFIIQIDYVIRLWQSINMSDFFVNWFINLHCVRDNVKSSFVCPKDDYIVCEPVWSFHFEKDYIGKHLTNSWLDNFLLQNEFRVGHVVVSTHEQPRFEMIQVSCNSYLAFIMEYVFLVLAEFIFNIDENEFSKSKEQRKIQF